MPYLVLGIAVVVGLVLLARGVRGAKPQTLARVARLIGLGLGSVLLLILTLQGGLLTMLMVALGTIPVLMRWRALSRMARSWGGPQPGQTSDIETHYLRMTLDHDTGELEGTVLEGQFKGRLLRELTQHELFSLLQECRVSDAQSCQVLETYIDRVYGTGWRSGGDEQAHDGASNGSGSRASAGNSTMTKEEAYEILGVKPGATPEEIKEAHRRLMLRMHPDQGGSTYLAAKINQAKDMLIND